MNMQTATALQRPMPPHFEPHGAALTAADFEHAAWVAGQAITVADLLDELLDAAEPLQAAIEAGDAARIGRIVLAVRRHYADRLGHRELTGHGLPFQTRTVAEAA